MLKILLAPAWVFYIFYNAYFTLLHCIVWIVFSTPFYEWMPPWNMVFHKKLHLFWSHNCSQEILSCNLNLDSYSCWVLLLYSYCIFKKAVYKWRSRYLREVGTKISILKLESKALLTLKNPGGGQILPRGCRYCLYSFIFHQNLSNFFLRSWGW